MSHAEGGTLLFFRGTDEELGDAGRLRAVWLSGHQTPADKAFRVGFRLCPVVTLMISVKMICTMNILRRG